MSSSGCQLFRVRGVYLYQLNAFTKLGAFTGYRDFVIYSLDSGPDETCPIRGFLRVDRWLFPLAGSLSHIYLWGHGNLLISCPHDDNVSYVIRLPHLTSQHQLATLYNLLSATATVHGYFITEIARPPALEDFADVDEFKRVLPTPRVSAFLSVKPRTDGWTKPASIFSYYDWTSQLVDSRLTKEVKCLIHVPENSSIHASPDAIKNRLDLMKRLHSASPVENPKYIRVNRVQSPVGFPLATIYTVKETCKLLKGETDEVVWSSQLSDRAEFFDELIAKNEFHLIDYDLGDFEVSAQAPSMVRYRLYTMYAVKGVFFGVLHGLSGMVPMELDNQLMLNKHEECDHHYPLLRPKNPILDPKLISLRKSI